MIVLDPNSELGLYEQLYQKLRDDIATGRLPKGSRLKSLRELEQDLNVSRTTISRAYQQLVSEGYVTASQGSGYYVEDIGPTAMKDGQVPQVSPIAVEVEKHYAYDFSPFNSESVLFLWKKWRKAVNAAIDHDSSSLNRRIVSSKGTWQLRENLASFLYHHRGIHCTPEQIVICTSDLHATDVLFSILDPTECRIAFEEPGVVNMRTLIRDWGFDVFSVPALNERVIPLLDDAGCNAIFTMPSCQLPLGTTMSLRDRNLLLRWASNHDAYIIEFDHHARFQSYGNSEAPSMQSLDMFQTVIYIGTLNEVLPSTLNLAYLILPGSLLEKYRERYEHIPPMLPGFYEQAFSEILEDGSLSRHVRKTEVENRSKLDVLIQCVNDYLPSSVSVVNGSISGYAIVEIKGPYDREDLIERIGREGVRIYSVYDSCHEQCSSWDNLFVFGFASLSNQGIVEGVKRIAKVFDSANNSSSASRDDEGRMFKEAFEHAIEKMENDVAVGLVEQVVREGKESLDYIEEGISLGIKRIGAMFDQGKIGVVELLEAADTLHAALRIFTSNMSEEKREELNVARVVLYTVEGDLHDLGKNIVKVLLEVNNFTVFDLGCNVPPEKVLATAEEIDASIIMGSALMTTTLPAQKDLVDLLVDRGVRDKYYVMFGGAPATEEWVQKIGGDAYTDTATDAVIEAKRFVSSGKL